MTTYQVLAGLKEGERIVTSGQFMLDSESQLREAIQKMIGPKERGALRVRNDRPETNQAAASATLHAT